jgi:hypothetical protein
LPEIPSKDDGTDGGDLRSQVVPLNENEEVRAATCNPDLGERSRIASLIPSQKYPDAG